MKLLHIALRNIFRNRRRSVLNLIALTTGFVVLLLGLGWVQGYHSYVYGSMIDLETGHAHYLAKGYLEEQRRLPVDIGISNYAELRRLLLEHPSVEAAGGRIDFAVKVAAAGQALWLIGRAVEPAEEKLVSTIDDFVVEGSFFDSGRGLLVGRPVAEALGITAGSTVFLTARDKNGVENFIDIKVAGIFDFGYPLMDKSMVFIDMESAVRLLDTVDMVNRLVARLKPGISPERFLADAPQLPGNGEWHSWRRFADAAVKAVEADSGGFYGLIVIIYILISLGVLNSLSMTVHERSREIGTLKALGWRPARIRWLFLLEALSLASIASLAGLLVSLPLIAWLQGQGVDLTGAMPADMPVPFGERFRADFLPWHFMFSFGLSFLTALLGAWLPAGRGARLPIALALRGKH